MQYIILCSACRNHGFNVALSLGEHGLETLALPYLKVQLRLLFFPRFLATVLYPLP